MHPDEKSYGAIRTPELCGIAIKDDPDWFRVSIDSMLGQTVPPDEIFIVCDGPLSEQLDATLRQYTDENPELFTVHRISENVGLGKPFMDVYKDYYSYYLGFSDKWLSVPSEGYEKKLSDDDLYIFQLAHTCKHLHKAGIGLRVSGYICIEPQFFASQRLP